VGQRSTHRAHGITPSELVLLAGFHSVTAALSPLAVSLTTDTAKRAPRTASQAAAPGHLPLHGSAGSTLNQSTPLGFTFLGFYRPQALIHPLGGSPLMCLASATTQSTVARTTGYQSAHDWWQTEARHNPSKVSAPFRSTALRPRHTGLMCSPRQYTDITAASTDSLVCLSLTGVAGIGNGC